MLLASKSVITHITSETKSTLERLYFASFKIKKWRTLYFFKIVAKNMSEGSTSMTFETTDYEDVLVGKNLLKIFLL